MEKQSIMPSEQASILAEERNRVGHLTLNRPGGLNALTLPMIRLLQQRLDAWRDDPRILAVVLRGAGEKAFCAGGDIRSLYESHTLGGSQHFTFFEEEYALDQTIHGYPKPLLALMDGFVLGGGMGLAQGAALRVISERTRMGMPETGIGYFPDVGASYFLPRLPGNIGLYLGITGAHIGAADALYAGLADWCVPHQRFAELDRRLDALQWSQPPRQALTTLLGALGCDTLPGAELKAMRPALEEHFAASDIAGLRAGLSEEQRPAYRDWAMETLNMIDSRSPLAISVTLELLRRGKKLSLSDCFALELHLDRQWFDKGDLIEGVRALLIDKDRNPRWNPPSLAEVTPQRVEDFFAGSAPALP
jgi:enoyl-CoA hydratase/carnithine racemase